MDASLAQLDMQALRIAEEQLARQMSQQQAAQQQATQPQVAGLDQMSQQLAAQQLPAQNAVPQQSGEQPARRRRGWDVAGQDVPQGTMPNQNHMALATMQSNNSPQMQGNMPMMPVSAYGGAMPNHMGSPAMPQNQQLATMQAQGSVPFSGVPGAASRLPPAAGVDGNWICVACQNVNFAMRKKCHRCEATKEQSVGGGGGHGAHGATVDDPIDSAAGTALFPVAHLETEWDFDKLRWKVAAYFRKAAVGLSFQGPLDDILDKYADKAFAALAGTLGDRAWLPKADFTFVVGAAVKSTFPPEILGAAGVDLDAKILCAHDRAFDEFRVLPLLWECLQGKVEGKKAQNKVYTALETGRVDALKKVIFNPGLIMSEADIQEQEAIMQMPVKEKVEKFISEWVRSTVDIVSKAHHDQPTNAMPVAAAILVFQTLLQSDTLPSSISRELLLQGMVLPQPYPYVDEVVRGTYQPYIDRAAKRQKVSYPKIPCPYFANGWCGYGDACINAHGQQQITPAPMNASMMWGQGKGGGGWPAPTNSGWPAPTMGQFVSSTAASRSAPVVVPPPARTFSEFPQGGMGDSGDQQFLQGGLGDTGYQQFEQGGISNSWSS